MSKQKLHDFSFRDSSGNKYSTSSLNSDFIQNYGMDITPNIILIKTDSTENTKYINQIQTLKHVENVEERSIIFVTSSDDDKHTDGYYMTKDDRKSLSDINAGDFHVFLLSGDGRELFESDTLVTVEKIEAVYPVGD
jgi:hypothetical protein